MTHLSPLSTVLVLIAVAIAIAGASVLAVALVAGVAGALEAFVFVAALIEVSDE